MKVFKRLLVPVDGWNLRETRRLRISKREQTDLFEAKANIWVWGHVIDSNTEEEGRPRLYIRRTVRGNCQYCHWSKTKYRGLQEVLVYVPWLLIWQKETDESEIRKLQRFWRNSCIPTSKYELFPAIQMTLHWQKKCGTCCYNWTWKVTTHWRTSDTITREKLHTLTVSLTWHFLFRRITSVKK